MLPDIKTKLQKELMENINEEKQVIYILSRIRKILEVNDPSRKYKKLKFFCDWALHAKINDITPYKDEFHEIVLNDSSDSESELAHLDLFLPEFVEFLDDYNLETNIFQSSENLNRFIDLLLEIYRDTPVIVIVSVEEKYEVKLTDIKPGNSSGIGRSSTLEVKKL